MPPRLTKPTNVPRPRQALVDEMWRFYVAAGRPSTRRIAMAIDELPEDQHNGSANHETIRRTLRGEAVGAWQTIEVIFLALCALADVDPDDTDYDPDDNWGGPYPKHRQKIRNGWHEAVDGAEIGSIPRTRTQRAEEAEARRAQEEVDHQQRVARGGDPWASDPPF